MSLRAKRTREAKQSRVHCVVDGIATLMSTFARNDTRIMPNFKQYHNAVKYLEDLAQEPHDQQYMRKGAKDPSIFLKRTENFLRQIGNPGKGFKYIHISGTSGKGSTTAYLHEIVSGAGFRVGSFYSPHSTTTIERIKTNEKLIDPVVFAQIVNEIKPTVKKMSQTSEYGRPSYFEILLGIALLYFKKMKCDFVILEVGCGGSYDATNIIEKSISAITNIGLDHTQILGKTLVKIAKDKAGIIKSHTHFFTTEKRANLLNIFKKQCKQKNAKFHNIIPPALLRRGPGGGLRHDKNRGKHQQANISLALAIARHLNIISAVQAQNFAPQERFMASPLPCRFEIMQKKPLIILDGAHNPDKMKSVVHNLKNLTYDTLYIIFAASATKDAKTMLKILLPAADEIVFTEFKTTDRKSYSPETLSKLAKSFKHKSIEHNALKALKQTIKKLKPNNALLITGSFYLAGELRKHWISENMILRQRKT